MCLSTYMLYSYFIAFLDFLWYRLGCVVAECSPLVREVVGSNIGWVKLKTLQLVFTASPLSTRH